MLLLTRNHFRQGSAEYDIEKEGIASAYFKAFVASFILMFLYHSEHNSCFVRH